MLEGRQCPAKSAGVRGCPCHCVLPAVCAGAACAPGGTSGAPVLGSLHLAVGGSISWRLLISLELDLGSALPKLNSSSVPLDCVFNVLGWGNESPELSCLGRDEGFLGIMKDCPLSVS